MGNLNDDPSKADALVQWCRQNPEVFGYLLDRKVEQAISSGAFDRQDSVADRLRISRQKLYDWRNGKSLHQDFSITLKAFPQLARHLEHYRSSGEAAEDSSLTQVWKASRSATNAIFGDDSWIWIYEWPEGLSADQVTLEYDPEKQYAEYCSSMPGSAKRALARWESKHGSFHEYNQAREDGLKVRLEGVTKASGHGEPARYEIKISQSRFKEYAVIQARLDKRERELIELRNECFENALNGLKQGLNLMLPSIFAIHMAVVTKEKRVLFRRRPKDAPRFPGAWECSVGEMMHGPNYRGAFPHFQDGRPSLDLFLRSALAEELGCRLDVAASFRLYGFAAEYVSLAPKLVVVCWCEGEAASLLKGAIKRRHEDTAIGADALELTVDGVCDALSRFPSWGPTSKLALYLTLLETETSEEGKDHLAAELGGRLAQKAESRDQNDLRK